MLDTKTTAERRKKKSPPQQQFQKVDGWKEEKKEVSWKEGETGTPFLRGRRSPVKIFLSNKFLRGKKKKKKFVGKCRLVVSVSFLSAVPFQSLLVFHVLFFFFFFFFFLFCWLNKSDQQSVREKQRSEQIPLPIPTRLMASAIQSRWFRFFVFSSRFFFFFPARFRCRRLPIGYNKLNSTTTHPKEEERKKERRDRTLNSTNC